jgi:hypothetical protein
MRNLILTLLLVVGIFNCVIEVAPVYSQDLSSKTLKDLTLAEENDIREAVFRYEFNFHKNAKVFFLSFGKKEPTDEFISRFAGHKSPVKKESQASGKYKLNDKETGKRGVLLSVANITRISEDEVKVWLGYIIGPYNKKDKNIAIKIYSVQRDNNKWLVTEKN